jgi:ATP-dependent Clp protease ATP-binding subunit ClpA
MPSFAPALETTLHNALGHAAERHHEYATLEHLLLALIDDEHASKVMQACGVDMGELTDAVTHYLDTELDSLKVDRRHGPLAHQRLPARGPAGDPPRPVFRQG